MNEFRGFLFDGRTAERQAVTAKLTVPGYLTVQSFAGIARYPVADLDITPRLGSQPAIVNLPGGARLEIEAAAEFFAALDSSHAGAQWQYAVEARRSALLAAVVAAVVLVWLVYDYGIPALVSRVAVALPAELDQQIGTAGLAELDRTIFAPSTLPLERRQSVEAALFAVITVVGAGRDWQLEFRSGTRVGANAFALPSGIIIVTDELVALAAADELQAILAHEVGHVRQRHAMRTLLQGSVITGLLAVMAGDTSALGGMAAGLPSALARAGYSRDFEYEADAVAKSYLQATGKPLSVFTDILSRLEAQAGGPGATPGLLRTHPVTRERLAAFLE